MNSYYIRYPRDFANEYTIYVVERGSETEEKLLDQKDGLEKITREKAIERGIRRVRNVRSHEQWFGGFITTPGFQGLRGNDDRTIIANAKQATKEMVNGALFHLGRV